MYSDNSGEGDTDPPSTSDEVLWTKAPGAPKGDLPPGNEENADPSSASDDVADAAASPAMAERDGEFLQDAETARAPVKPIFDVLEFLLEAALETAIAPPKSGPAVADGAAKSDLVVADDASDFDPMVVDGATECLRGMILSFIDAHQRMLLQLEAHKAEIGGGSHRQNASNFRIPPNYFGGFPPTATAFSGIPDEEEPILFDQKPLFRGPKKDRTVVFKDDEDDDDEDQSSVSFPLNFSFACLSCYSNFSFCSP